jgi:hypothetical protein
MKNETRRRDAGDEKYHMIFRQFQKKELFIKRNIYINIIFRFI